MNINFIKWMVGYADGFEFKTGVYNQLRIIHKNNTQFINKVIKDWGYYPLLLQRAIEGINKTTDKYLIFQCFASVYIEHNVIDDYEKYFYYSDYTIDKAKEAALKYIWEQEK